MHLYLHVPFCRRRCSYCDFSIVVRKRIPAQDYVDAIRREIRITGGVRREGEQPLETIYFGGGTPSLLPPEALAAVLFDVSGSTGSLDAVEVTVEANPEDVTPAAASAWRRAGVNRVSLGAQSFDDAVLRWMHRSHGPARIADAVRLLRAAGIENVSLDLIFGLPPELHRDWNRDLDLALSLLPSHLSLYGLTVEERTPLARWIARGATAFPDDERYAAEYLAAHERLAAQGYEFYEVSNAALPGRRSRHNQAYWSARPYRGLGPAAHSFDGRARRWNLAAWEAYRRAVSAGRSAVESEEVLNDRQRELERVYLALRTSDGLACTVLHRPPPTFTAWVEQGWAVIDGARVRCTPEGWLRLDSLVRDLTGGVVTA